MNRTFPTVTVASPEDIEKATGPSTKMAVALNHRGITYVKPPAAVIAQRRKKNKAARAARRAAR